MNIFYPHCTTPPDEPGIVSPADIRGTLDIVWSCLAVVLLCTWVVLHENVPVEGATESHFWEGRFLEAYLAALKTSSFVIALFAPELFTGKAMMCLYFARHVRKIMEGEANEDRVEWTIYHAFLANMGGFTIEFNEGLEVPSDLSGTSAAETQPLGHDTSRQRDTVPEPERKEDLLGNAAAQSSSDPGPTTPPLSSPALSDPTPRQLEAQQPTKQPSPIVRGVPCPGKRRATSDIALRDKLLESLKKHDPNTWFIWPIPEVVEGRWREDGINKKQVRGALETAMTGKLGYHSPQSYFESLMALRGNIWVVDGVQLQYARRIEIIQSLPDLRKEEIKDRSKGDWATKSLAIMQVTWLWVQLIVRTTQSLAATQLEIMTAAFATCSFITFMLYFKKPKDVKTRIRLTAKRYPSVEEMAEMARRGPIAVWFHRVFLCIDPKRQLPL